MAYDLDHQWGDESKHVQAKGCMGCLLMAMCALMVDALAIWAIVSFVRFLLGA